MSTLTLPSATPRKGLTAAVWAAQAVLALFFLYGAWMKLGAPAAEAAKMMPWTAQLPLLKLFTGVVDLAGGLGILLPTLTRIQPRLTVLAALGIVVLQVLAFGFHASRGEWPATPFNVMLLALAVFVLWGRGRALSAAGAR